MNANDFFTKPPEAIDVHDKDWIEKVKIFGKESLDAAIVEMRHDYDPDLIYRFGSCGGFNCIEFKHEYIEALMYFLMHDDLKRMSVGQRSFTQSFIEWEDKYSNCAMDTDEGGHAIGATNDGYVVIYDYIKSTTRATPPCDGMTHTEVFEALDKVLRALVDGYYDKHSF